MNLLGFRHCCTADELGGFYGTPPTTDEVKNNYTGPGMTIATLLTKQIKAGFAKPLLEAGFIDVGTYRGRGGVVHLLVHGLRVPKSLPKRIARAEAGAKKSKAPSTPGEATPIK